MSKRACPDQSLGNFIVSYTWDGEVLAEVIRSADPIEKLPGPSGQVIRAFAEFGPNINAQDAAASLRHLMKHLEEESFPDTGWYAATYNMVREGGSNG
jgi:hypothetical protein